MVKNVRHKAEPHIRLRFTGTFNCRQLVGVLEQWPISHKQQSPDEPDWPKSRSRSQFGGGLSPGLGHNWPWWPKSGLGHNSVVA